tara:strand:- start:1160 stop:1849 length:690 start_codon:yes stop_codon:yes gene_type:complete
MKQENEKISVVMSIYNGEDTLEAAIDSILNQSYKNLEILLMDDFSTDDSFKILKEYEKKYNNIKVFRNKKNKGLTYSLNYLINKSRGSFIARQDADDTSSKYRLEKQIKFLKDENLDFCTTRAYLKNSKRKIPGFSHYIPKKILIKYKNPFIHGTLLIRAETFHEAGLYNEKFIYSQDYKLFSDLLKKNIKFRTLGEPLYELNMSNNISTINKDAQNYYADCVKKNIEL